MSEPVYRTSAEVSGIWFFDEASLKELDQILDSQWDLLKKQQRRDVSETAKEFRSQILQRMERNDPRVPKEKEEAKKRAERHHEKLEKAVVLKVGFRDVVKGTSFADLVMAKCADAPNCFTATIVAGKNSVSIELDDAVMGSDKIKIRIQPINAATSTALAEIEGWAERTRESSLLTWFREYHFFVVLLLYIALWFGVSFFSQTHTTYPGKAAVLADAEQLLKVGGVSEANRDQALTILLRSLVETTPRVERVFVGWWAWIPIIVLIPLLVFFMNPPKSVIGVGRGRAIAKRRMWWYRLWSWSMVKWIVGLLLMALLVQPIMDKVRAFLWNSDTVRVEAPATQK